MSESQIAADNQVKTWFWKEVGDGVEQELTAEQKKAIESAVQRTAAGAQPADIRLNFGSYFLRIIAGKERRNRERLDAESKENPLLVSKNFPVLIIFWTLLFLSSFYAVGVFVKVLTSLAL